MGGHNCAHEETGHGSSKVHDNMIFCREGNPKHQIDCLALIVYCVPHCNCGASNEVSTSKVHVPACCGSVRGVKITITKEAALRERGGHSAAQKPSSSCQASKAKQQYFDTEGKHPRKRRAEVESAPKPQGHLPHTISRTTACAMFRGIDAIVLHLYG